MDSAHQTTPPPIGQHLDDPGHPRPPPPGSPQPIDDAWLQQISTCVRLCQIWHARTHVKIWSSWTPGLRETHGNPAQQLAMWRPWNRSLVE